MRWKVMAGSAAGWLLLFAAGALVHIQPYWGHRDPGNYETWWDFQLDVYIMIMLPIALPLLIVALAVEYWGLGPKAGSTTADET